MFSRFVTLCLLIMSANVLASDESAGADYSYFGFEPDIITNYIRPGNKLGYVRVTAEVMVRGNANLELVEHHAPILRAAIVEILGRQQESQIKSLAGRDIVRQTCLNTVNQILTEETGAPLAADVLFTKYIYY